MSSSGSGNERAASAAAPLGVLLWSPSAARVESTTLSAFARRVRERYGLATSRSARSVVFDADTQAGEPERMDEYEALHRWSIECKDAFWRELWDFTDVIGERGERVLVDGDRVPGARWFPDASLNYAENLLERQDGDDSRDALVFWGEDKMRVRLSYGELRAEVSRVAQALSALGVKAGDRVAAFTPNMPEAIIAMLASASLGAIFTSASPDFGVQGVVDRFGQIEPVVLFTVDGYWYNGKAQPILAKVAEIVQRLPTLARVVVTSYLAAHDGPAPALDAVARAVSWNDFVAPYAPGALRYDRGGFDRALFVLYSSGTTGVPKCIVHAAGGALLQHLKEHRLHGDVKPGDRLFYFTTCGWMMWNWLASGLASGATLLLYDGSPFLDRGRVLWDLAEAERMTHFGTSAKYIDAARKIDLRPRDQYALPHLRTMFSTGSPLAPEGFDYVYECVKEDLCLSSISGGTDIMSCFALGCPTRPVWRGEIQCRGLGMAVDVFDDDGQPVRGRKGELVCTESFPSMPIGFWDDPGDAKYRAAYFERFPGVWWHGDYCEITAHDGIVIYGRSDATLNPGGVRIGTAEIYRQVEQLDEVVESLVIGQDWPPGVLGDVRVILFVRLRDGLSLDQPLVDRIKQQIRTNTTPRHVPAKVVQVDDIPRTKSGKIVELAVRKVVHGDAVRNIDALANPEALEHFRDREELRT